MVVQLGVFGRRLTTPVPEKEKFLFIKQDPILSIILWYENI
jgi:hypothetical protein